MPPGRGRSRSRTRQCAIEDKGTTGAGAVSPGAAHGREAEGCFGVYGSATGQDRRDAESNEPLGREIRDTNGTTGLVAIAAAVISTVEHIDGALLGHVERNHVAEGLQLPAERSQGLGVRRTGRCETQGGENARSEQRHGKPPARGTAHERSQFGRRHIEAPVSLVIENGPRKATLGYWADSTRVAFVAMARWGFGRDFRMRPIRAASSEAVFWHLDISPSRSAEKAGGRDMPGDARRRHGRAGGRFPASSPLDRRCI